VVIVSRDTGLAMQWGMHGRNLPVLLFAEVTALLAES
jgi:hypothetical protein